MRYQILKQYIPGNDIVWVGSLGEEDQIEIFDTLEEAEIRMEQLKKIDPKRGFKIVEKG